MYSVRGFVLLGLVVFASGQDGMRVETLDGPVVGGIRYDEEGTPYHAFEGIPFAAPPVGELRFQAPQPVQPWTEPRDASGYSFVKCVQYGYMTDGYPGIEGTEDCLYLTVYVPANRTSSEPMAVMYWIYGGSLTAGSNQFQEYGPMKWINQDVIVVEPLYRVGPFGFTYLGVPEAPGNQGFLDLVKGLEWVNKNIDRFGGDPNRVTIFGESSGSWAVSYLHLTPLAKGLFQRAIMQSGSLFNPYWTWQTANDSIRLSDGLASAYKCSAMPSVDPYGALECLQNLDYEALEESINWGMEETFNIQKIFRPTGVIDGNFLPDHPVKMMERGEYNHIDLMVGLNKDEGLLQTYQLVLHPELYPALVFGWQKTFGPMFLFGKPGNIFSTDHDIDMTAAITSFYLENGNYDINPAHFDNITDMISDAYIWYGGHKQAELAAKHGDNVYQYIFSFKGTYGFADAFGVDNSKYGVCHADELYYFWFPYWSRTDWQFTPEEIDLSEKIRRVWSNFAKHGTPTLDGDVLPTWMPVLPDNHQYMVIDREWGMDLSQQYLDRIGVWEANYEYPEGDTIPDIPPEEFSRAVEAGRRKHSIYDRVFDNLMDRRFH